MSKRGGASQAVGRVREGQRGGDADANLPDNANLIILALTILLRGECKNNRSIFGNFSQNGGCQPNSQNFKTP